MTQRMQMGKRLLGGQMMIENNIGHVLCRAMR